MEYWDLYNEKREKLGISHLRGEPLTAGCYHLVVHIWLRNSRGQYLVTRRAADRPTYPLFWECPGGSALRGEDSLQAALREAREETGIALPPNAGRIAFSCIRDTIDGTSYQDILDAWLFDWDGEPSLQDADGEVAEARWMDRSEIQKLRDDGVFVPTLDYFFDSSDI